MEPMIPVNVTGEMLSDTSMMALNLNGPSLTPSTMTHDEAIVAVARLSDENCHLKGILNYHELYKCFLSCLYLCSIICIEICTLICCI